METLNIFIFGEISRGWGANKIDMLRILFKNNAELINVYISSEGGDIEQAFSIHDLLKSHPAKVVTHLTGMCASSATIIANAGDEIIMSRQCVWMIHPATTFTWGDKKDHEANAQALTVHEDVIADIYARKTGKPKEEVQALMDLTSWFTPEDALEMGFVDQVVDRLNIDFETNHVGSNSPDDEPMPDVGEIVEAKGMQAFINKAKKHGFDAFKPSNSSQMPKSNFLKNLKSAFAAKKLKVVNEAGEEVAAADLEEAIEEVEVSLSEDRVREIFEEMMEEQGDEVALEATNLIGSEFKAHFKSHFKPHGEKLTTAENKIGELEDTIKGMQEEIAALKGKRAKPPRTKNNGGTPAGDVGDKPIAKATLAFYKRMVAKGRLSQEQFEERTGMTYAA